MRPLRFAAVALALPAGLAAQGTVSSQGLGYPPGQLSTMARGAGGAFGDFDPSSPLNPAAIAAVPATSLFANYLPESRRVTAGGATDDSRVVRFPVVGAVLTMGQRAAVALSSSTLLDRSWATTSGDVADETSILQSFESRGALNDVRLAGAYTFGPRIHVGAGVHVLAGENRLSVTRIDRTGTEASFSQSRDIGYSGTAASAGLVWSPIRMFSLAAMGQVGGSVRAKLGDSTFATATAPARASASLRYTGLTGAVFAARVAWDGWSSLADLGSEQLGVSDATEIGIGADVAGPRIFGRAVALRAGGRWRDLPFATLGEQPSEQALTAGLGIAFASNRALLDLAVERARRTAGEARETAWVLGVGLTVRP